MPSSCIRVFADTSAHRAEPAAPGSGRAGIETLAAVLALAGNEVRLKMLFLLLDQQQLCVCDLADVLQMNVSAISQHLRKLKDGGVVQARKVGQTVFYTLTPDLRPLVQPLLASVSPAIPAAV